ncbi:MAG: DUF488 domain-containing protein [Oceanisphaera sp.]|uniref:DUF488 domain-containing protein n=1 Tax=Oceanisphaera sp. TaxID=1929979 RepID=UPI003F987A6A
MPILLKRAYEPAQPQDGYRVLVDKLWPRGVSKAEATLDDWLKDIAPSHALRQAFHNEEITWGEFRNRYLSELTAYKELLRALVAKANQRQVTLVYAAKDEEHNNAVVLKQYLKMLG